MKLVTPVEAKGMVQEGALLVDIRETYEFNAETIDSAVSLPLSTLPAKFENSKKPVVFFCKSGARTYSAYGKLKSLVDTEPMIMQGGIMAWKSAGLPTIGGGAKAVTGASLLGRLLSIYGKGSSTKE